LRSYSLPKCKPHKHQLGGIMINNWSIYSHMYCKFCYQIAWQYYKGNIQLARTFYDIPLEEIYFGWKGVEVIHPG
jgi:hypothetical protein